MRIPTTMAAAAAAAIVGTGALVLPAAASASTTKGATGGFTVKNLNKAGTRHAVTITYSKK